MKRRNLLLCTIAALMFIPLSATWAVWEGNAGIAAASEFPGSGMYAKSDMFPKNTIVEIQNLETGSVVRAVITGSSGVPGLVAVLSPEAAYALNIASGSVSRVRISTPSPVAEKPAAGTVAAPTGNENRDPDVNPAVAAESASPVNLETVTSAPTDPLVPLSSTAPAVAGTVTAATVPAAAAVTETAAAATPVSAVEPPAAAESPAAVPEPSAASEPSVVEATPSIEIPVAETAVPAAEPAIPAPVAPVITAAEIAPEASESAATVSGESAEPAIPAPVAPVITAAEIAPEASESTAAVSGESAEPEVPPVPPTVSVSEAVPPASETTPSTVVYDEPVIAAAEAAPPAVAESEVTLVTASENPPVAVPEETAPAVPVAEPVVPAAAIAETPAPAAPVTEVAPVAPVASTVPVSPVAPVPLVAETKKPDPAPAPVAAKPLPVTGDIPVTASLAKGFYVQIASYAEASNVRKLIDSYGKKYPVAIERGAGKSGEVMKVLIGPVKKDEYGAVLERFRQLGFKDAFVKKVQ